MKAAGLFSNGKVLGQSYHNNPVTWSRFSAPETLHRHWEGTTLAGPPKWGTHQQTGHQAILIRRLNTSRNEEIRECGEWNNWILPQVVFQWYPHTWTYVLSMSSIPLCSGHQKLLIGLPNGMHYKHKEWQQVFTRGGSGRSRIMCYNSAHLIDMVIPLNKSMGCNPTTINLITMFTAQNWALTSACSKHLS